LNIPQLLAKHFPQHGPYLGIYAIVEDGGDISVDDSVKVIDRSTQ
jgi:MOSC domain-containing protein YiiM